MLSWGGPHQSASLSAARISPRSSLQESCRKAGGTSSCRAGGAGTHPASPPAAPHTAWPASTPHGHPSSGNYGPAPAAAAPQRVQGEFRRPQHGGMPLLGASPHETQAEPCRAVRGTQSRAGPRNARSSAGPYDARRAVQRPPRPPLELQPRTDRAQGR